MTAYNICLIRWMFPVDTELSYQTPDIPVIIRSDCLVRIWMVPEVTAINARSTQRLRARNHPEAWLAPPLWASITSAVFVSESLDVLI